MTRSVPPVALVTGANRGIGLELVRQYTDAGWKVISCCRNPDLATDLHEIKRGNTDVVIEALNVADPTSIDALVSRYRGQPIDVLINNAGTCAGHVNTRLGIGGATLEIATSVVSMRLLIDPMTMEDSGTFRRYDGDTIAW